MELDHNCGICGVFKRKGYLDQQDFGAFRLLWLLNESRGEDASGYAACVANRIIYGKAPLKVSKAHTLLPHFLPETKWIIGHCRYATQGKAKKNYNNHPVVGQKGLLIHNGCIRLLPRERIKTFYDVDTEYMVRLLDYHGYNSLEPFTKITGSFSVAYSNFKIPKRLFVLRGRTSPLAVYKIDSIFAFTSEIGHLQAVYPEGTVQQVSEGTRFTLTPKGEVKKRQFKFDDDDDKIKGFTTSELDELWAEREPVNLDDYEHELDRLQGWAEV
jgi:glucosamine 6-phosphate synthetase-like amidotransferase/phosphosugar isomerase protein